MSDKEEEALPDFPNVTFLKHQRIGRPHEKELRWNAATRFLYWVDVNSNKEPKETAKMMLSDIKCLELGKPVVPGQKRNPKDDHFLMIVGNSRSLHMQARSVRHRDIIAYSITKLVKKILNQDLAGGYHTEPRIAASVSATTFTPVIFYLHQKSGPPKVRELSLDYQRRCLAWSELGFSVIRTITSELGIRDREYVLLEEVSELILGKAHPFFERKVAQSVPDNHCLTVKCGDVELAMEFAESSIRDQLYFLISDMYLLLFGIRPYTPDEMTFNFGQFGTKYESRVDDYAPGDSKELCSPRPNFAPVPFHKHTTKHKPADKLLVSDAKNRRLTYGSATGNAKTFSDAIEFKSLKKISKGKKTPGLKRSTDASDKSCMTIHYGEDKLLEMQLSNERSRNEVLRNVCDLIATHEGANVSGGVTDTFNNQTVTTKLSELTADCNKGHVKLLSQGAASLVCKDIPRLAKNCRVYKCSCLQRDTAVRTHAELLQWINDSAGDTTYTHHACRGQFSEMTQTDNGSTTLLNLWKNLSRIIYGLWFVKYEGSPISLSENQLFPPTARSPTLIRNFSVHCSTPASRQTSQPSISRNWSVDTGKSSASSDPLNRGEMKEMEKQSEGKVAVDTEGKMVEGGERKTLGSVKEQETPQPSLSRVTSTASNSPDDASQDSNDDSNRLVPEFDHQPLGPRSFTLFSELLAANDVAASGAKDIQKVLKQFLNKHYQPAVTNGIQVDDKSISPSDVADRAMITLLKCINQNMIYPGILLVRKLSLGTRFPVQDVKGGWSVDLKFHQREMSVTHRRRGRSRDDNSFTYTWELKMTLLAPRFDKIAYADFRVVDVTFERDVPLSTRQELVSRFNLLSTMHPVTPRQSRKATRLSRVSRLMVRV